MPTEPDLAGRAELGEWERLAEKSYSDMYDVPPFGSTKSCYEDACFQFARAIEVAQRLGLDAEVERLTKRRDHIMATYNSQFRGL